MAFVDAGYLTGAARKLLALEGPVEINGNELTFWAECVPMDRRRSKLLRVYVYDAAFAAEDDEYSEQRKYFDRLASSAGVRLRLGHLVTRDGGRNRGRVEQKGVDTLLVLDLVRMAQQGAFDTALVIAGDRDLAEALRVIADDHSRRVVLFTVEGSDPHKELVHVTDVHGLIEKHDVSRLVKARLAEE